MKSKLLCLIALMPMVAMAQDYVLYESQYLTALPGHGQKLSTAIDKHNEKYHAEAPFEAHSRGVINGPRTGDVFWYMGPSTFSDYDKRPTGDAHDNDWANTVLAHASNGPGEYWVKNDELSYTPEGLGDEERPIFLLRFFEVSDNAAFVVLQKQIIEVIAALEQPQPRTMYQKQFQSRDGRDWVAVSTYASWSELDKEDSDGLQRVFSNFPTKFKEMYGDDAWSAFGKKFDEVVLSREDEWQQ